MDEKVVVEALDAAVLTDHRGEVPGDMYPSHQAQSVLAERRIERLALGGGKTVQREGDTTGDELGHGGS
jgi:hypothetical protein